MRKVSRRAIAKFGHQAPHLLSVMCLNVALHSIDLTRPSGIHNDYNLIGSPLSAGGGAFLAGMSNRSVSPRDIIQPCRVQMVDHAWSATLSHSGGNSESDPYQLGRPQGLQSRLHPARWGLRDSPHRIGDFLPH